MKQLHHLLERYYRKSGNQIVFLNGKSLNKLSLEIMEDLGFEGMDSSLLSRVINGKRLFSQRQLNSFCRVLNLDLVDKLEMESCILSEKLCGLNLNFVSLHQDDEDPINYPKILKLLRKRGFPLETISVANDFQQKILASKLDQKALTILAEINNEKSRVYGEISTPEKIMADMYESNKIGKFVGEKYDNISIKSMAYMNIGGGLYVAKKYNASIDFLEHNFSFVDLNNKLEFLRTLMLNYSYTNNYNGFLNSRRRISKLIEKHALEKMDVFASVQDAIARSLMIFGKHNETIEILDQSQQIKTTNHFRSQLLRTTILNLLQMQSIGLRIDKSEFLHHYKIIKSKQYLPFSRHQQIVDNAAIKFETLTKG